MSVWISYLLLGLSLSAPIGPINAAVQHMGNGLLSGLKRRPRHQSDGEQEGRAVNDREQQHHFPRLGRVSWIAEPKGLHAHDLDPAEGVKSKQQ